MTMLKIVLITIKNFTTHFDNIILILHNYYHINFSKELQNKLAIVYKTVANRFLEGYSIAIPTKVTNFATYKHSVNNIDNTPEYHNFVMFII